MTELSQSQQATVVEPSVELNTTTTHQINNYGFDNIPKEACEVILKDGRAFSYFIEPWLAGKYPLTHVKGCKSYDFTDKKHPEILYDEKTFTKGGCRFCPSNMIGVGRKFDKGVFEEKCDKLIFCVVSNINFPVIKIRFVKGSELAAKYPKDGKIPFKDHDEFFN
jgi:hypothetical protein